jgi:2-oxoglutarate ferredoxin oxidoreductase subunit delta
VRLEAQRDWEYNHNLTRAWRRGATLPKVRFMPEAKTKGYIEIDQEHCKGCQACIEFCPKKLIVVSTRLTAAGYTPVAFQDAGGECTGCAICAIVCPEVAIEVYRG